MLRNLQFPLEQEIRQAYRQGLDVAQVKQLISRLPMELKVVNCHSKFIIIGGNDKNLKGVSSVILLPAAQNFSQDLH